MLKSKVCHAQATRRPHSGQGSQPSVVSAAARCQAESASFKHASDATHKGTDRRSALLSILSLPAAAAVAAVAQPAPAAAAAVTPAVTVPGVLRSAVTVAALPTQPLTSAYAPAVIRPELTPDQSKYDPTDQDLRDAANMLQSGLNAGDVVAEERVWSEIIEKYSGLDKPWVPDVVGRAWGNRGNARSRQGKLLEALADYNTSISICPWSVDPVLNRGVVLESLGRFDQAISDYKSVLAVDARDPAAWNNLGNASAGLGKWQDAAEYYGKAAQLAPGFSFAAANQALALYQLGQADTAIREMRSLLRRYPTFTDMRAGLAAALWGQGLEGQAEAQWERVDDSRYRDRTWVREQRRWPPRLVKDLEAFLDLQSQATA